MSEIFPERLGMYTKSGLKCGFIKKNLSEAFVLPPNRRSRPECSVKKCVLKKSLQSVTLPRFYCKCFPLNFPKLSKNLFRKTPKNSSFCGGPQIHGLFTITLE